MPAELVGVSVAAGLIGAVVMNLPMRVLDYGSAPAYVAAAALRRKKPTEVSERDAAVVHHVAGMAGGVLYAAVVSAVVVARGGTVDGGGMPPTAEHLVSVGVVGVFIYFFFAYFVLPRFGGELREEGDDVPGLVRRSWLVSVVFYAASLAVVVPLSLR